MERTLVFCIVVLVIGALLAYLAQRAPMLDAGLKQIVVWAILAIAIVVVVFRLMALI